MIVVIGIAGAGKSTQGQLLSEKLDCPWVSIGQLLRSQITDEPTKQRMLEGEILSDDVVLPILEAELKRLEADKNELVLDGSPRTMRQAERLAELINSGDIKLTAVIHLLVSKDTVKKRLLSRGRPDDTIAAIAQRSAEFDNTILPIINYLKEQGYLVHEIDGEGPVEADAEAITKALNL